MFSRLIRRLLVVNRGGVLLLLSSVWLTSCSRAEEVAPGAAAANGVVAITSGRVIDGTGAAPIESATILIRNGRVEAVGPSASVTIPEGASRIEAAGKTITPGLISAHSHVAVQRRDDEGPEYGPKWFDDDAKLPDHDQLVAQLGIWADYGITTVFSLGEGTNRGFRTPAQIQEVMRVRDEQAMEAERGSLARARVYFSGPAVRGPGPETQGAAATAEEGRKRVAENVELYNVDAIKLNMGPALKAEVYTAVIDEATKRGRQSVAHLLRLSEAHAAASAGISAFGHSVRDQDIDQSLIAEMKRRNVAQIPTLMQEVSEYVYETIPDMFTDPFLLRHESAFRRQMQSLSTPESQAMYRDGTNGYGAPLAKKYLAQALRNLKMLSDAGVTIAMGTDSGGQRQSGRWPGYYEHGEMELMAKAGMTPMQIIVASTIVPARLFKVDDELGSIQPGRWADLVIVNADPLTDIKNLRQIDAVWIAGKPIKRALSVGTN